MFQLALRLWTGEEMIYPVKFSVIFDLATRKSSVRAFIKNDKIITFDYMMITPFNAINGPIFEKDIIVVDGDEEHLKIVDFDEEKGIYIARDINGSGYIKMNNSRRYETAGNIFEDSDLLGKDSVKNNSAKEEKIVETKEESLKNEDIPKDNSKNKKTKKDKKQKESVTVKEQIQLSEQLKDVPKSENKEDKPEKEKNSTEIKEKTDDEGLNTKEDEQHTEEISIIKEEKNEIFDDKTVKESTVSKKSEPLEEEVKEESEVDGNNIGDLPELDESSYLEESTVPEEVNILVNTGETKDINIHFISVFGNNIGGYAFTFECDGVKDTYKGSEENTNSKKIDLSGIISALEMLDGSFNVTIYTNSQYVVYPFLKGWIHKWKETNWFKNDTDRIQNYELWSELYEFYEKYNIKWVFVNNLTDDMKECLKFAKEEI